MCGNSKRILLEKMYLGQDFLSRPDQTEATEALIGQ